MKSCSPIQEDMTALAALDDDTGLFKVEKVSIQQQWIWFLHIRGGGECWKWSQ